jgi:glutamine cyclotransferase
MIQTMNRRLLSVVLLLTLIALAGCQAIASMLLRPAASPEATVIEPVPIPTELLTAVPPQPVYEQWVVEVLETYPHDSDAFTQGLVWTGNGTFYESTGLYGESDLREVDIETGEVLRQVDVPEAFFAEGLAQVGDRLIQITWQENIAFVYDAATFEQIDSFTYETEGWGLCYDGERLIMSDGTSSLYFRDPQTFELLGQVTVLTPDLQPLVYLNELECVEGKVYANVWTTPLIVRIDPATGLIDGVALVQGLISDAERAADPQIDVLNGIAYDAATGDFYITGKRWPSLFKVRFVPFVSDGN